MESETVKEPVEGAEAVAEGGEAAAEGATAEAMPGEGGAPVDGEVE